MRIPLLVFRGLGLCLALLGACTENEQRGDGGRAAPPDAATADASAHPPQQTCEQTSSCGDASPPNEAGLDACPAPLCLGGASFDLDWPLAFEAMKGVPFTVCHDDECRTGMLTEDYRKPPIGGGVGFSVPDWNERGLEALTLLTFFNAAPEPYLNVMWVPSPVGDLGPNGHYRITIEVEGETRLLLDEVIEQAASAAPPGSCGYCPHAHLDLRGMGHGDGDAGLEDDAGI
jgi:hypothetical protein